MTSRIVELRAENFKRLKAVRIRPDGAVYEIGGRNGAGKSSVLDAIAAALGGGRSSPTMPIRSGEVRAEVVVELDDLIVRRRWTASGSTLEVASKEGAVFKSPQAMLDKVVGDLSFDPLAFSRMRPAEQSAILARIAGIDLAGYEARRQALYAARTEANREAKAARAALDAAVPPPPDCPKSRVDVAALVAELDAAEATVRRVANCRYSVEASERLLSQTTEAVADLERRLADARRAALSAGAALEHATKELDAAVRMAVDPAPIKARIADADRVNRAVEAAAEYQRRLNAANEREAAANRADDSLIGHDATFAGMIAESRLPIPGLRFGSSGGVMLDGVPLDQASAAQRLRVSVAVGLALNPGLRLMLVHDGSLLDGDSMAALEAIAEQADAQVIIERVGERIACGVVIEDGEVVAERERYGTDDGCPVDDPACLSDDGECHDSCEPLLDGTDGGLEVLR